LEQSGGRCFFWLRGTGPPFLVFPPVVFSWVWAPLGGVFLFFFVWKHTTQKKKPTGGGALNAPPPPPQGFSGLPSFFHTNHFPQPIFFPVLFSACLFDVCLFCRLFFGFRWPGPRIVVFFQRFCDPEFLFIFFPVDILNFYPPPPPL